MLKLFTKIARTNESGKVSWRVWAALAIIPVIVGGGLALAFWAPKDNHGTAKAAVVNNDEPAEINGQLAPLGREMGAKMVGSTDSGYSWQMTDEADAEQGLNDGTYSAVVTIPEEFSRNAASSLAGKPVDATRAMMQVQTSPAAAPADAAATTQSVRQSVQKFNQQVVEMYLNGIYGGFSTLHDELGKAGDGADQLADGGGQLADGTSQLAGGTDGLAQGVGQLSGAAHQLADGGGQLADGISQLSGGSGQLAGGLTQAAEQTAALPEQTQMLADGAKQVAAGNRQFADQIAPLADQIIKVIDLLPELDGPTNGLAELTKQCPQAGPTADFCDKLNQATEGLAQQAGGLDQLREQTRQSAVDAKNGVQLLAFGAEQVANGNQQLADHSGELAGGIAGAADGTRQLDGGIKALDGGAHQLSDGLGQFAGGTGQLVDGTGQLAGGARQLDGGTHQLADGNREMANGLHTAVDNIPSYSDADRDHLKTIASNPAAFEGGSQSFGRAAVALFVALALWAGALATYSVSESVSPQLLASRKSTWRIMARSAIPGASAAGIASLALSLILTPFLDLSFGQSAAFFGVTLLSACTFVTLNQAMLGALKRPGQFVSIAVLVLTLATGVISTVPPSLIGLADVLPTHGTIASLNAIVGGTGSAFGGIAELVVWLAIGAVASIMVTDRHRAMSGKQLRRASEPAAAL